MNHSRYKHIKYINMIINIYIYIYRSPILNRPTVHDLVWQRRCTKQGIGAALLFIDIDMI